jgi:excisionase family DNA binding protein
VADCFVANYIIRSQPAAKLLEVGNAPVARAGCQARLCHNEDFRVNHRVHYRRRDASRVTNERFLTLADVAEILNISASQSYALVRSGELQGIQIGGRNQWRVERSKLEEYIDQAYQRTEVSLADLPSTLPSDA